MNIDITWIIYSDFALLKITSLRQIFCVKHKSVKTKYKTIYKPLYKYNNKIRLPFLY